MRFSSFVLKNVFRRRTRSALTMVGIAVAVGAVVSLVGISDGFTQQMLDLYQGHNVALVVSRADAANPLAGNLMQAVGDEIAALPEVGPDNVCPGLVDVVSIEDLGLNNVLMQGWPVSAYMFREVTLLDGQRISEDFHPKKAVMLGKNLAKNTALKAGDKINLGGIDHTVVGVFESFSDLENSMVVMSLPDAQKQLGKPNLITGCSVRLKELDPPEEVVKSVRNEIEGTIAAKLGLKGKMRAAPPAEMLRNNNQLKAAKAMAWMTSAVALFIGTIGMLNTMVMSVFERTREIGILRAIGWRPGRVMRMILMESIILSIGGGIIGALGGAGLTWGLSKLPNVNGAIQGSTPPNILVLGFLIAICVGLIGAAYPAFRGSRLLPTEALRHE
jgi:putative ABC transport system permease protein